MAIEIEKNGGGFYKSVARQDRGKDVRSIFTQLAAREKEHEKTYRDMLSRLGGYRPPQEYAKEQTQYIKELGSSSIFTGERAQAILAKKSMTDVEALETGIGFEKDSILFYSELRGMVPKLDQEIIESIISEEQKHFNELTYMANQLRSGM